ncbi:unnamed protein product [Nippostrongylus brasiliensis]|uniref:Nuclear receptor domain-containing protein n=1 Tax=Nippostrongylus brasiliensis TaxID=27835 RepID=A0A158QYP5_NIPBR|nr:unnamed protein product [Nippostrongylus brasiliensis]
MNSADLLPQSKDSKKEAQATGFHFDAQSCSACAAFFRRTVSLNKKFDCIANRNDCQVHYSMHQICRSCRFEKCLKAGMNRTGVQPRKTHSLHRRTFCTKSGLKRNKRFAVVAPMSREEREQIEEVVQRPHSCTEIDDQCSSIGSPEEKRKTQYQPSFSVASSPLSFVVRSEHDDVLAWLVREEMKLGERRRILFCERPVDKAWPDYHTLGNNDKVNGITVSFLRKCVLFHTILDPVYISLQIGIYLPLLKKIMSEIIPPMLSLDLSFEEFVALKAFVSWQGDQLTLIYCSFDADGLIFLPKTFLAAISNVSIHGREAMRRQIDAISKSLHLHYQRSTGLDFVESHRQIEFFDLWHLDSLLLQFLNLDSILAELNSTQV